MSDGLQQDRGVSRATGLDRPLPHPPRSAVVGAIARMLLNIIALLALYYLLPFTDALDGRTIVWLAGGLAAFFALMTFQVHAILRARHPGLRAVEGLGAAVPLFVLLFAAAYFLLSATQPASFSESLTRTDALYFTVTVFATVGFGDITPTTETARLVVSGQMVGNLIVIGLLARVVFGAVRISWERQAGDVTSPVGRTPPPPEDDSSEPPG